MKHSPGPWKQEDTDDGDWIVRMDSAHFVLIGNLEDTCGICHANATLIVAAPEMLKALEKAKTNIEQLASMVNALAKERKVRVDDFTEEVVAAIKKATEPS